MPLEQEQQQLEEAISAITEIAERFKLDFFPMRYEICPSDIIYTFGAYGMPTRFSHWSFGKTFYKMKMQYDLGLSKIYELVINSNPCYAFLLDGNSLVQNKLIVAHVLAHCDFFKNNARFSISNRNMVESMSAAAERIHEYEIKYGALGVEQLIDAVLAIQEHIDPSIVKPYHISRDAYISRVQTRDLSRPAPASTPYDDIWSLDKSEAAKVDQQSVKNFPPQTEKDILWFIEEYSSILEPWQRDILTILRDEMLYFRAQIETKIMNEGWATFFHQRIMRELNLTADETIEYAKLNSGVVQPSRNSQSLLPRIENLRGY